MKQKTNTIDEILIKDLTLLKEIFEDEKSDLKINQEILADSKNELDDYVVGSKSHQKKTEEIVRFEKYIQINNLKIEGYKEVAKKFDDEIRQKVFGS